MRLTASLIVAQLLFLESEDPGKDIQLIYQQLRVVLLPAGHGYLRYHAVHQVRCIHHLYRYGSKHGSIPAGRRNKGKTLCTSEC